MDRSPGLGASVPCPSQLFSKTLGWRSKNPRKNKHLPRVQLGIGLAKNRLVFATLTLQFLLLTQAMPCARDLLEIGRRFLGLPGVAYAYDPNWKVIAEIGRGGGGVVYKISHRKRPKELRAFKASLTPDHADLLETEARQYEASARGGLPHLAHFFRRASLDLNLRKDNEMPKRVSGLMIEFFDGLSLESLLDEFQILNPDEGFSSQTRSTFIQTYLDYLLQLCDFIEALHKMGKIGIDISPSNVMAAGEKIRVLDPAQMRDKTILELEAREGLHSKIGAAPPYFPFQDIVDGKIDYNYDFFSIGMMIFELLIKTQRSQAATDPFDQLQTMEYPTQILFQFINQISLFEDPALDKTAKGILYQLMDSRENRVQSIREVKSLIRLLKEQVALKFKESPLVTK